MDFISRWDANYSNHQKRQVQLIEFLEKFSTRSNTVFDVKRFEDEFSVCGSLFIVRLLSAIRRSFNCAQPVDLHLRVLLVFFQASDWEQYLDSEDATSCMHVLLTVASLDPSIHFDDVEQALIVLRRMLQSARAAPVLVGLNGVRVVGDIIEATLNTQLHRICTSILFECASTDDPFQIAEAVVRLFKSPRGSTKYCALSLCRQLMTNVSRRGHILKICGHQWLIDSLPQLVRLLINRPIFYQYECAAFLLEVVDIPEFTATLLPIIKALTILRCVVGGTSVIDNDAWKFIDTTDRSKSLPPPMNTRPLKWGKLARSLKTTSKIDDTVRDVLVVVSAGKNKPMADAMAAVLPEDEIAQDPTVIIIRFVALLLNTCDGYRIEIAQTEPVRFGGGIESELICDVVDVVGTIDSVSLSSLSQGSLPIAHRSAVLFGAKNTPAAVASLSVALSSVVDGGLHTAMLLNMLGTVHNLLENNEAAMLRKLILLAGRPQPFGTETSGVIDLTESYSLHPLQFHSASSRTGMSLEKFYHDGVAVTFLMMLYTLQRWMDTDATAKAQIWDMLSEFDLLRAYESFDFMEDFESLGDESSEESGQHRLPPIRSMRDEQRLDLYALMIVYIRLAVVAAPVERLRSISGDDKKTDIAYGSAVDLVARQRRTASFSDSLDYNDTSADSTCGVKGAWSPRDTLSKAVDALRRRLAGGALIAQLKNTLHEAKNSDTKDRYTLMSKAGIARNRDRVLKERKTRSPYSPGRSRFRPNCPAKGKSVDLHDSMAPDVLKDKPFFQSITSLTSSFSVGLQDDGPHLDTPEEDENKHNKDGNDIQELATSFQELLNAAMHGTNLSDYQHNNTKISSKLNNFNCKAVSKLPRARSSRASSANGSRRGRITADTDQKKLVNSVSKRLQADLKARLAEIRNPNSPTQTAPSSEAYNAKLTTSENIASFQKSSMRMKSREARNDECVRFSESPNQKGSEEILGMHQASRIVIPTPPANTRGSFRPTSVVEIRAESPRSPRRKHIHAFSAGRSYKARDSPRAYRNYIGGTGGLSSSDCPGMGNDMMQDLQAMYFDTISEQDDFY